VTGSRTWPQPAGAVTTLELFEAISDIVSKVSSAGTTFVAPAATIDQFSRIAHRKEVYLALFKPQNSASWRGNLKKYDFTGSPPVLRGVDGIPAIEPETGNFLPGSQSYWATEADGADITDGGAASHLDPSSRKIVTHLDPGNFDLFSLSNAISTADSSLLTAAMIGANDDNEFGVLVDWLAGFDVKDENKDNNIFDRRNHIGDPLHTNPVVVTYGAEPGQTPDPENPNSLVFFGTNEGFLHAINTIDGTEEFAFMPPELLSNVPKLFANNPTARNESKPYGLDGDITLWTSDANNNGIIESDDDDKAILYVGMRRGGNRYYAIDVSDRSNPKYIRKLEGGAGDYAELGQTWSKPIITKVKVGSEVKTVAVFGGGYDPSQDDNTERKEDSIGRAIYFTDIETGELVWSGGNPATQSALSDKHQPFANMNYSIPSDLAIVTDPKNGYLSQIYVGDMGGRLWRFDINNGSSITELVSGGIIADFAEDDNPKGTRRFYNKPDLSISRVNGRRMINIAIGSGYRAHPLNRIIEDKFFLFKYPYKGHDDSNYGVKIPGTTSYRHATLDDLYDTTENLIIEGDTIDIIDQAKQDLAAAEGWYITMDLPGEKILASSNTLDGILRFVSYAPMQTQGVCDPNIGKSFYWAINLSDGAPAVRTDNDNPHLEKEYRKKETPGLGLAPPISTIFVEHEGTVTPTDVSGVNTLHEWNDIELQRRWFWSEQPD